ncbi:MAG: ribosomal protein S18-alanine N-acetyltransferase [Clostridia bacterium]|nr:ribosomal protein S18-alanine N-acetyltransferase [Clostridia bacterium]
MNITEAPMQNDLFVRRLSCEDLHAVAEVERASFADPWSEKMLELLTAEPNFGFCAELRGEIVGYGGMQVVLDEGQITDIAVMPEYRRRGIAAEILSALLSAAKEAGLTVIFLEVRVSNLPALALYERFGFEKIGTRRNFYAHPREDAYNMRLFLS